MVLIQSRDTEPTTDSAIEGSQKLILVIYIGLALQSCPGNISTLKWTTIIIASKAVATRQQFLDVLPGFNLMVLNTSWSLLPVQCLTYFVDLLLNLMISVLNWGPLIMYLSQTLLRRDHIQPTSPSTLILDISLLFTLLSVTLLPALVAAVIIDNLFKTDSYLSQWFLLLQANHPPITLVLSLIPPLLMKVPPSTVPLLWGMHTFLMVKV